MVFCGLFPIDTDRYADLRDALDKLALNDAALSYEPETSDALGFGFRCGFLGLLHMEIVRERLEREYGLELLATTPNVRYEVHLTNGESIEVRSPTEMPDPGSILEIEEPYIRATIICPKEQVGPVMELCQQRRGTHVDMHYLSSERVQIRYDMPLAEIVLDFFDLLKSSTRGYASLDYEPIGNRASDLVKVDILLAGDRVDALSIIVHREFAYEQGKRLVERLRKTIPRQMFDVPVQAAIGSNILARETVKALRKDVTAKLYGGDVTRKNKLLKKQKAGKKRMKAVGRVEVPAGGFPGGAGDRRIDKVPAMAIKTEAMGKEWPATTYQVGREKIREYAAVLGIENPVHFDREAARAAGFRDVVAPPMFAVVYSSPAVGPAMFDPDVGMNFAAMVHGGQEFEWSEPACSGDEITTVAKCLEIFEKDGKGFYVFETNSVNQDGDQVVRGVWTNIVRGV